MQRITYETYTTTVGDIADAFLIMEDILNITSGADFLVLHVKDSNGKNVEYRLDKADLSGHYGFAGEIVSINVRMPGILVGKDVMIRVPDPLTMTEEYTQKVKLVDVPVEFVYTVTETM